MRIATIAATVVLVLLFLLCVSSVANAALPGYSYVKTHTIQGSADGIQSNYQVKFTVYSGTGTDSGQAVYLNGHSLNWPNDIRFTDSNDVLLSFWVESSDSNSATVWVKVPSIPASPGTATVKLYYGKAGEANASNGGSTFPFFDDFPGTSYDTSKWTLSGSSERYATVANGELAVGQSGYTGEDFKTVSTWGSGYAMRARMKSKTSITGSYSFFNPPFGNTEIYVTDKNGRQETYRYNGNSIGTFPYTAQTYAILDCGVSGSHLDYYINGGSHAGISNYAGNAGQVNMYANHGGGFIVDWVLMRAYTYNEPGHGAWGAETPITLPVASFTATPLSGTVPLSVQFTDASTGNPTGWQWDFGDGTTGTVQNPSHTYNSAGTFTVILTASNAFGSNTLTRTNYITVNVPQPIANFSADATSGNAPFTVQFTDTSTGNPTAWQWNFGDGGTSDLQNPQHVYTSIGAYTVSLTASNAGGDNTATKAGYINVESQPTPTPTATPIPGGEYNSAYVSDSLPDVVMAGSYTLINVSLRNTGDQAWYTYPNVGNVYVDIMAADGTTGSILSFSSCDPQSVSAGSVGTFNGRLWAPATPGTYTLRYQLARIEDGRYTPFGQLVVKNITVTAGLLSYNATYVADTIPATITRGEAQQALITFKNTGNASWDMDVSKAVYVKLEGIDSNNSLVGTEGGSDIVICNPGGDCNYYVLLNASFSGTYTIAYQLRVNDYSNGTWKPALFGPVVSKVITVNDPAPTPTPTPVPVPDARIVSDTIPTMMDNYNSYTVAVTIENTGTMAWSANDGFALGAIGVIPGDAAKFGSTQIDLPAGTTVQPGEQYTFSYRMTAPPEYGDYALQYRMIWPGHYWFGDALNKTITVENAYNATYVSDNIPASIESYSEGGSKIVYIAMKNTGTKTWHTTSGGSPYVSMQVPIRSDVLSFGEGSPSGDECAPGQTHLFYGNLYTNYAPGYAGVSCRLYSAETNGFGSRVDKTIVFTGTGPTATPPSPTPTPTTTPPDEILYRPDAEYIGSSGWPEYNNAMTPGETITVSLTMKNTGDTDWSEASHVRLSGNVFTDSPKFGASRFYLPPDTVVSHINQYSNTYTFYFTITAPSQPGQYHLGYQMFWDDVWGTFGEPVSKTISVAYVSPNETLDASRLIMEGDPITYENRIEGYMASNVTHYNVQWIDEPEVSGWNFHFRSASDGALRTTDLRANQIYYHGIDVTKVSGTQYFYQINSIPNNNGAAPATGGITRVWDKDTELVLKWATGRVMSTTPGWPEYMLAENVIENHLTCGSNEYNPSQTEDSLKRQWDYSIYNMPAEYSNYIRWDALVPAGEQAQMRVQPYLHCYSDWTNDKSMYTTHLITMVAPPDPRTLTAAEMEWYGITKVPIELYEANPDIYAPLPPEVLTSMKNRNEKYVYTISAEDANSLIQ